LSRAKSPLSLEEKKIVELADRHRLANIRNRVEPILASFGAPPASARP
jgi:hypothetical protein